VVNTGVATQQIRSGKNIPSAANASAPTINSVDTTADSTVAFVAQLATATDTICYLSAVLELLRP